jgi:hypothetical protein
MALRPLPPGANQGRVDYMQQRVEEFVHATAMQAVVRSVVLPARRAEAAGTVRPGLGIGRLLSAQGGHVFQLLAHFTLFSGFHIGAPCEAHCSQLNRPRGSSGTVLNLSAMG